MTRDVAIYVKGMHKSDDTPAEPTEIYVEGEYFEKGDSIYILYDEVLDSDPVPMKNVIKIHGRKMTLTRKGSTYSQMILEENQSYKMEYQTQYGVMSMDVHTSGITIEKQPDKVRVSVMYELSMGEFYQTKSQIHIAVTSKNPS